MKKKRILQILALVLLLSMMLSTVAFAMPPGQAKKLLKNEDKYEKVFKHMKDEGIMFGDGFGNYGFGDFVKRSDITVMIVRAFKLNMMDVDFEEIEENFLDIIDKNIYYYNAVNTAKKFGIAKGDGKNFNPNKNVSYEEAILMIERAVKVANSNVTIINEKGEEVKLRDWYKDNFEKNKLERKDKSKGITFKDYLINLLIEEEVIQKHSKTTKNDNYIDEQLSNPASRKDIASMLYYILTGDDYNITVEDKLPLIKESIKENTILDFGDLDFEDYFEDYDIDEIKFELPNEDEGTLEINDKKISNIKYEIEDLEDITFVPVDDFSGKVEIIYTAYDEDDTISYTGVIEITVLDVYEIKDIEIKDYYEEDIDFVDELKQTVSKNVFSSIDYVVFELPAKGELLIKYDEDSDDKNDETFISVVKNKKYNLDEIEGLKYENDGNKEITIFYSAYEKISGPDKKYDGAIVITME